MSYSDHVNFSPRVSLVVTQTESGFKGEMYVISGGFATTIKHLRRKDCEALIEAAREYAAEWEAARQW